MLALLITVAALCFAATAAGSPIEKRVAGIPGLDVSSYQGNVDLKTVAANGAKWAYVKATEGTDYTNAYFAQQYEGSYNNGLIRGAYHFARPDVSSGTIQANYIVAHGGGWSDDAKTLPGMLDIECTHYPHTDAARPKL